MAQILILEEDKKQFVMIKQCVEEKGHKVFWSARSSEALESLNQFTFDLIISAVNLEGSDPLEFLRTVKECPQRSKIPFVFCCSDQERDAQYANPAVQSGVKALGAQKFIVLGSADGTAQLWEQLQDCLPEGNRKTDVLGGPVKTYSIAELTSLSGQRKAG
jgi:CheY-like chemotaxis protein